MIEDVFHQAVLHQDAVLDDGHMVAYISDHRHLVGDNDDGDAGLFVDLFQQVQDLLGGLGIQGTGRFVAEQDRRIACQGPGNGHSLLLPAGKLGREGILLVGKTYHRQELSGLFPGLVRSHLLYAERKAYIFDDRFLHQQVEALKDHADPAAQLPKLGSGHLRQGLPFHQNTALCGNFQIVQAPYQRAFTGSGHAYDSVDISLLDLKVDIPECLHLCVLHLEGLVQVLHFHYIFHLLRLSAAPFLPFRKEAAVCSFL